MKTLKILLLTATTVLVCSYARGQVSNENEDILKAQNLAKQGNNAEASRIYTEIMGKYPDNKEAVQGWLILNMKKSPTGEEDAIKQLEELEKSYPGNTAIVFFKVYIQAEYKHFDDALKSAEKLIKMKPGDGLNWVMKGQILEFTGNNDGAMEAYLKATSLDGKSSEAWQNLAGLQAKTNHLDDAIYSYTKAIELTPGQAVFVYNRGCAYARKGDKANALADLAKAVSMNPEFKSFVLNDQDFKPLWEDADFKKVVSQ